MTKSKGAGNNLSRDGFRGLKYKTEPESPWDADFALLGKRVRVILNRDRPGRPIVREGILLFIDCFGSVRLERRDGRIVQYECIRGLERA